MPWSAMKTIPALEGKPREYRELFAEVANDAISKGRSEEEAIFAGLSAVNTKFKPKSIKKQEQQIPWHLKAVLEASKQTLEPVSEVNPSRPTLLIKNALTSDPSRSLVAAEFDNSDRLVLTFDDAQKIITRPIDIKSYIEQYVSVKVDGEGGTGGGAVGVPVAPTLVSPVGGGNASGLSFTVSGYSHPSNVVMDCVLIETATNVGFTTSVQRSSVVPGGLTVSMTARSPGTTVYWRAKFIDRLGGESGWSATGSFVTVAASEYVGYSIGGNDDSATLSRSVTGSVSGDFLVIAVAYNGIVPAAPSGWTLRLNYTDDPLTGSNMAIYTTVASTSNQVVSIPVFSLVMVAVRGVTDYVSVERNTIAGGASSVSLTLPSGAAGVPCCILGFDRGASATNTLPASFTPSYGGLGGGSYFSQIFGFASSATGGTWTRSSSSPYKAHALVMRLQ